MKRGAVALGICAALFYAGFYAGAACAQRAGENPVAAAEDAFGTSVGNESIGLYSSTSARGFSPVQADNVRIDGLYFDQQAALNNRVISGSTVHVGISAQAYAFPAPTGVADFHLRIPGDLPVVSTVVDLGPYNTYGTEVDAQLPMVKERLSVGFGGSVIRYDNDVGAPNIEYMFGALFHATPSDNADVTGFWSRRQDCDYGYQPAIYTAGDYLPPRFPLRKYFGQNWDNGLCIETNFGALGKVRFGDDWTIRAGVFRSFEDNQRSFSELLTGVQPDGAGDYSVVGFPRQTFGSYSGEIRATKVIADGAFSHKFDVTLRGRDVDREYGGSDQVDFGTAYVGVRSLEPAPAFDYGPLTHDHARQGTGGISYDGTWMGVGELDVGVQKTFYNRTVMQPGLALATTQADPFLYNVAANGFITQTLTAYASYTRGLEESGVAPQSAVNRGEAMPPSLTQQIDAGLRYAFTPRLTFVAGVFQVEKPYFNLDDDNVFGPLGTVRHRGIELSMAGKLADGLTVIGGAVLIQPRVSGPAVDQGLVGRVPVGPEPGFELLTLQYGPQSWKGFSIDGQVQNGSSQIAHSGGAPIVPAWTQFNLGARYIFRLYDVPASVRFQALNVTNAYSWGVNSDGSFFVRSPRNFILTLAADF